MRQVKVIACNATTAIQNMGGTGIDTANAEGSRYIVANDCLTCHKINEKSIGAFL